MSVTKAQTAYFYKFAKPMDIKVDPVPFGESYKSNVSFVVGKVDSPSMVDSNVRIIDQGHIGIKGRLEIKLREQWTTISKDSDTEVNNKTAQTACR